MKTHLLSLIHYTAAPLTILFYLFDNRKLPPSFIGELVKAGFFHGENSPPPPSLSLSLSLWDFLLHCHHHQHIRVLNLIQFEIKSHYRKPYLPNAFFFAKLFSPTNSLDQKIWGLSHLARIKGDFVWMTICCFVYRVYFLPFVSWNTHSHSHAHTHNQMPTLNTMKTRYDGISASQP